MNENAYSLLLYHLHLEQKRMRESWRGFCFLVGTMYYCWSENVKSGFLFKSTKVHYCLSYLSLFSMTNPVIVYHILNLSFLIAHYGYVY